MAARRHDQVASPHVTELAARDQTGGPPRPRRTADVAVPVVERAAGTVRGGPAASGEVRPAAGGGRLAVLDGLRLLAAVAVVAKHWVGTGAATIAADGKAVRPWGDATPAELFGAAHVPAAYGWLGVNLFFLISGFVICMSAWGRGLSSFFTSRVARLLPAYWFAVVLTVTVLVLLPGLTGGAVRGGATNVLLNLTMVQQAYRGSDVDPSYWTLWIELRFYLLFAVLVAFGLTYRRVLAFLGLWTVAALASVVSGEKLVDFLVIHRYAPYFIAGIAFYLIYRYGQNLLLWGVVGFNYAVAVGLVRSQARGQMVDSDVDARTAVLAGAVTLCFAVMALVAVRAFDRIRWRWLTVAGALTYPLYLLHQVIGFVAIHQLRAFLPPVAVLAVVLAGMLVLAWLVSRFVERPMSRWLRTGLRRSFSAVRQQGGPADAATRG